MNDQTIKKIEHLKRTIGAISFNLPNMKASYVKAIAREHAIDNEIPLVVRVKNLPERKFIADYKSEMRYGLLEAVKIGEKQGLDLQACRRMAVVLDSSLDPIEYAIDAAADLDRLIGLLKSPIEQRPIVQDDSKYPGLTRMFRDAKENMNLSKAEKSYRKVAERYRKTLDTNDRPTVEMLKRWLERPGNH